MTQRIALWMLLCLLAAGSSAFAQPADDGLGLGDEDEGSSDAPAEDAPADEPAGEPEEPPVEETPSDQSIEGEASGSIGFEGSLDAEGGAEGEAEASAEVSAPPVQSDAGETIVTGTRIKRTQAFTASAPVEVVDRKALEYSGASNLADAVQYMTVSQGSGSQGATGAAGTSAVNLRGLGEGATLLLINGRRINPTGGGIGVVFADMATIPLAAVEKIEILKGGASAIYGADAVGGVVNIITRKNFDGVRFELEGQVTDDIDQYDYTGSAAFGSVSDRGRVMFAASYFYRNELNANERDWTEGRYQSVTGYPIAWLPLGVNPMTGRVTPLGLPRPDSACGSVPGTYPMTPREGPVEVVGQTCWLDYRRYSSLLGNGERVNMVGTAEYDVTNHTSFFGEITASRLRGDAVFSPSLPVLPPYPVLPGNHPDNPDDMNRPVWLIGRPLGSIHGESRTTVSDDTLRGVLGIRGDFEDAAEDTVFESWEWEIFGTMGISRFRTTFPDNLRSKLQDALNSCGDPSDLSMCFNPFFSAYTGMGTPNSETVIASFSGEQVPLTDHAMQTYNAGMNGTLFELPGGEFGVAFGGEIRHEWRATDLDHDANTNQYAFLYGNSDARAERDVYSGYLELLWPFFDGIEVQTAARIEHYTDINSTPISPSAGITLTPSEMIGRENTADAFKRMQIRGFFASAFRAPTLFQSFPGYATVPQSLQVMPAPAPPVYIPVTTSGNPDIEPETALSLSAGLVWSPVDWLGLSLDAWYYDYKKRIAPENPQQILNNDLATGGMDERVLRQDGVVTGVKAKQINFSGSTITDGLDFGAMINFDGSDFGGSADDFGEFRFGAQGTYTHEFKIPLAQTSPRVLPGIPPMPGSPPGTPATPRAPLPPPDCDGTTPTSLCEVVGKRNETNFAVALPQWKVNFPVLWTLSGHGLSVIVHYISGMEDDIEVNLDGSLDPIDAWVTVDAQYSYTLTDVVGENLTFRLGVYNIADSDPPIVNGLTTPYESQVHDARGRIVYAKLSAEF